jgi:hypothetical protein
MEVGELLSLLKTCAEKLIVHRISTIVVGVAAESYEQVLIWKYFLP